MHYPTHTDSSGASAPRSGDGPACAGADQRLFFPRKGGNAPAAVAAAKRICAVCPIAGRCLDGALAQGRNCLGVWGGTTEAERRAILRARREPVAA